MNTALKFAIDLSLSYLGGRALTVFYKRSFSMHQYGTKLLIELAGIFVALVAKKIHGNDIIISVLVALIVILAQKYGWQLDNDVSKALVISLTNYVVLFLDFSETTYLSLSLIIATTQFLRRPNFVRDYLRDVRIIFGPVYIVIVLSLLRFIDLSCNFNNILSMAVLFCSLLAAIFFRPDNNVMFQVLVPVIGNLEYPTKAWVHGLLMFTVLVINTLKLVAHGPIHYAAFGIVNILLYVGFTFI